jgi:indole-3-glycerol phosphate synthase
VTDAAQLDRLAIIVEEKKREVARLRPRAQTLLKEAETATPARPFASALRRSGEVRLLAEVKRRSPSAGEIRPGADSVDVARRYAAGGAAALSVLTDERFFGGSLDDLLHVRAAVDLPVLRKDFVIDSLQLSEARAAGADAVLLIVRILEQSQLRDLHTAARELGMDVLVEIHERSELDRALAACATLIGINNRDLSTFQTDLALSLDLAPGVDSGVTLVAESGIRSSEDVRRLGAAGVDAVLVGESLMRQPDLQAAAEALVGLPRDAEARPRSVIGSG